MNNLYDITIAIPVYNVEAYVEKSICSALEQDFTGKYEVLIIDDKGTDQSINIIHKIMHNHPKGSLIRIIEHTTNKGLGPARNTSIKNAQGEYLLFLDSDDWLAPNCLTLLYKKAIETNAEIVVGSLSRIEENSGKIIRSNNYKESIIEHEYAGVFMFSQNIDMHIEVWNKLFKLEFLNKYHIECVHRIMEDYIFDFNMRCNASKIAMIPNITLFYNVRSNSIVTQLKGKKGTDESAYTFSNIIERLQTLITQKYQNIPNIYDLYYCRVIWALEGLESSSYTTNQWQYIMKHIKGYHDFITKASVLHNPRNKFLYIFDKEGKNLDRFYKINKLSKMKFTRIIFKILRNL